ncbi:MAG: caspase family protein [Crocinitomicaceae bacterium]|nr:caspase family protein [Crocinitomicaceae bacterium]
MRKWFFLIASIGISFALYCQTGSPTIDLLSKANNKSTAHVISIGFDYTNTPDSCFQNSDFDSIRTHNCGHDAQKIVSHLKLDTNFELSASFLFIDSTKHLSSKLIYNAMDSIIFKSDTNDVFIFYLAAQTNSKSILLSNGDLLSIDSILFRSNHLASRKQIYLIDYEGSDNILNKIVYYIKSNPYQSKLNELNRMVFSVDVAIEKHDGGVFTNCLNNTFSLTDLFKNHRERTRYFRDIYAFSDLVSENTNAFNIKFFSEKEFSEKYFLEKEITRSLEDNNKDNVISDSSLAPISRGEPLKSDNEMLQDSIIEQGETLCLIIGNNSFQGFNNLNNTTNDSKKLKDILASKYQTTIIYEENIAYVDYLETLLKIKKKYQFKPGSQFLIYIASHGSKEGINGTQIILSDSKRKKSGILVNAQPVVQLQKFMNDLSATKTLLILDVCYSGGSYDYDFIKCEKLKIESEGKKFYNASVYSDIIKNTLTEETNLCIASASQNQTASDGVKGSNSPFSFLLIKYLKKYKKNIGDAYQLKMALNKKDLRKLEAISDPVFITYGGQDLDPSDDNFLFIKK